MNTWIVKNLLKCNLLLLFLQVLSIIFIITGIITFAIVTSEEDKKHTWMFFVVGVISYVFSYIVIALTSIFIYLKKYVDVKKGGFLAKQFLFGLIPFAQQYTWYTSIMYLKSTPDDNPNLLVDQM